MTGISLLAPPIAFVIVLAAGLCLSLGLSRLSPRKKEHAKGAGKPYACGEETPDQMIQPNYGQFLPFAVFFTILHVVSLVAATVPRQTTATLSLAVIYVFGAVVGLSILYRR